jgi:hypothetical protein
MLTIEATESTPQILFSPETQTLLMAGESYPENSFDFFDPVFNWLSTELPQLGGLTLEIKIKYMNSSSTKCMLDILDIMTERYEAGTQIEVKWYIEPGNERARELAEEFQEDMEIPFKIIEGSMV